MVLRDGWAEFVFGQPHPSLLPVAAMQRAAHETFEMFGSAPLAYGAPEGVWPLLEWQRQRTVAQEQIALSAAEIIGTAGNSQGLDEVCTLFTTPGDIVFVEVPTYHLALKTLRDHRLSLHPIPIDAEGLRVDLLEAALLALEAEGKNARALYTIPTFHNPTGISLTLERRRQLVALAERHRLLIIEDDVYRELWFDVPPPPSLFALAPRGQVIRLGSYSKTLAPGLRLGFVTCSAEQALRFADDGVRDSGGAPSFAVGMMVATLCRSGGFDTHLDGLRQSLRARRDALLQALDRDLPAGCQVTRPGGGYFIWLTLPPAVTVDRLLPAAERHRVSFVPGTSVCIDGRGQHQVRLAFSLLTPEEMADGVRRIATAIADVS
jgi:DNA-binding transcriptional MocR family regulator